MPTATHEAMIHMFQHRPALAAEMLADTFHVPIPGYQRVRLDAGDLNNLTPTEFRADAVVVLTTDDDTPQLAVIVEAQLCTDKGKRWSWPVYLTTLRARLSCPTVLLVVCATRGMAAWCATPIDLGHPGLTLTPLVLGPDRIPVVTDVDRAASNPQLAGLSAIAHGNHPQREEVFHAFLTALQHIHPDQGPLYYETVLAALPESAQPILEKLMTTGTFEFKSQFARTYIAQGRAEGEARGRAEGEARGRAEGEAQAILGVLDARGIHVPDDARARITTCTDLGQLNTWVRRAATAATIEDLFV